MDVSEASAFLLVGVRRAAPFAMGLETPDLFTGFRRGAERF